MSKLSINYSQVMRKARKIDDLSSDVQKEINRIRELEDSIRAGWKGKASENFLKKLSQKKTELQKTKRSMEELSDVIKKTAKKIKEQDEKDAARAEALFR